MNDNRFSASTSVFCSYPPKVPNEPWIAVIKIEAEIRENGALYCDGTMIFRYAFAQASEVGPLRKIQNLLVGAWADKSDAFTMWGSDHSINDQDGLNALDHREAHDLTGGQAVAAFVAMCGGVDAVGRELLGLMVAHGDFASDEGDATMLVSGDELDGEVPDPAPRELVTPSPAENTADAEDAPASADTAPNRAPIDVRPIQVSNVT